MTFKCKLLENIVKIVCEQKINKMKYLWLLLTLLVVIACVEAKKKATTTNKYEEDFEFIDEVGLQHCLAHFYCIGEISSRGYFGGNLDVKTGSFIKVRLTR